MDQGCSMPSNKESDEFDQTESHLRTDAEAGDIVAAFRLAFEYDRRGRTDEALYWGLRVVDSGDTGAMMLLTGISPSSGYLSRDQHARDRWLEQAAEQGCEDAAMQLAHRLYGQGRIAEGEGMGALGRGSSSALRRPLAYRPHA